MCIRDSADIEMGPPTTHIWVNPSVTSTDPTALPGSKQAPFRTPEQAQDAMRAGRGNGTRRVVHLEGMIYLNRTLFLEELDSGEEGAEIVWTGGGLSGGQPIPGSVSYTHLRAHETPEHLVCRLLLEKKKKKQQKNTMQKN
eukprot:TRINITY_DN9848_c0_g1_i1.p1 TRINITY_DN9848_c0_g1~~TRINITY_DN9848_c0_g1_i1.p1  ORF type:complete len:141 (+),score=44.85 TRINITY_DN9848_c0_g1_i1:134-556(+)